MYKLKMFLFAVFFVIAAAPTIPHGNIQGLTFSYPELQAEEQKNSMSQVQLIMKKLRASMSSMKDFDELENAGMSKKDVDRMRRAMSQKIEKLTKEAVELIRKL